MRHFEKKCRILERTGYSMAFFRVSLPCPLFSAMRISPLLSLLFLFSALSAWGGTYVNSTPKELQDKLAAAVESAAKEFNFAIRGVARRRLQKSTRPYDKLFLELDGERVTFERNGSDRLGSGWGTRSPSAAGIPTAHWCRPSRRRTGFGPTSTVLRKMGRCFTWTSR